MATAIPAPTSVDLFYSYAHSDEALCRELQKHLTALKRAGLIRDWYDRKIDPGSEWAVEIQNAMERASLILLLISADFLASKYIFDVELPFAIERQKSGLAKVIPILLRPVEWRDLPFAKFQVLPAQALPVTSWPNPDQAFSDIAGSLRGLIYGERLSSLQTALSQAADTTASQQRVLDAAIASSVVVDEPTDLVTMFRLADSQGLKAILSLDRTYSPESGDVRSKPLEIEFPQDRFGKLLPGMLGLALDCPGFDPPRQQKQVRIPVVGDSDVFVFMLTPRQGGSLKLNLQVLSGDVVIGSRLLSTKSKLAVDAEPVVSYGVVSWPMAMSTRLEYSTNFSAYSSSMPPGGPAMPSVSAPAPPMPTPASIRTSQIPAVQAMTPSPDRTSKSSKLWISIGSGLAAIAMLSFGVIFITPRFVEVEHPPASSRETHIPAPIPDVGKPQNEEARNLENRLREAHRRAAAIVLSASQKQSGGRVPTNEQIKEMKADLQAADRALRAQRFGLARDSLRKAEQSLSLIEAR